MDGCTDGRKPEGPVDGGTHEKMNQSEVSHHDWIFNTVKLRNLARYKAFVVLGEGSWANAKGDYIRTTNINADCKKNPFSLGNIEEYLGG